MRLRNKTALVTGSATGIGLAIATAFVREGARVVMTDINHARLLKQVKTLAAADRVLPLHVDITEPDTIRRAHEKMDAAGYRIDVLVNNAAVIHVGNILQTSLDDLRRVFNVNVEGTFNVTREFLPGMIERGGGVILNMASLASVTAMHDRFAYSASKAAIQMMTRSVALDFVKQGIRANCICPARVHTELVENYVKTYYADRAEVYFQQLSEYQPVGRMIRPEEVAHLAVYLCSDEAQMVTGASYLIDGGVMAGR